MRVSVAIALLLAQQEAQGFAPSAFGVARSNTLLNAEIRDPTEKADTLRFGWDGSTALGGAVVDSQPARMLDDIRAVGETIPEECELFNANLEMDGSDIMFADVIEMIERNYETGLLEFKNGDILNKQGENEGSAHVLSYAALSELSKATTLTLWGEYYRDVLATPDGDDHQNIRNFMKSGWEGVPFENGIALTKKAIGENEWDAFAESWIP
eukprot:CAMPEP_0198154662 /NCGR_PEP_ID=MMETSP1443-20131203/68705_1 /TAXON_ID=186043 /ORGANISM="Entomoneis sp., Strain CCMP2396" /LENGTH=211 /DNA_ID=CAMNT_0043821357 /DNA_START=46 /DNA_END=681 /DNA_ORIENTATION=+